MEDDRWIAGYAREGDADLAKRERAYINDRTKLVMPVLAIEVEPSGAPLLVRADSPLDQRKAVTVYGLAIKREMRYVTALADAKPEYFGTQRAWLVPSRRIRTSSFTAAGVVSFTHDDGIGWSLTWMYLHPYERGSGLIEEMWPYFVRAYGNDFHIDEPISPAAQTLFETRWPPGSRSLTQSRSLHGPVHKLGRPRAAGPNADHCEATLPPDPVTKTMRPVCVLHGGR